ncbi:MAG: GIY-YIG nuclease family protein [Desulfobacteraceae bacterium]
MPFYVYIIQSESTGRYYCGSSSDPIRRLRQHNDPDYNLTKTTKRFKGPWKLIWHHQCPSRAHAMTLEIKIKKRGIERFLNSILIESSQRGKQPPCRRFESIPGRQ